jgi:hypothetical protein
MSADDSMQLQVGPTGSGVGCWSCARVQTRSKRAAAAAAHARPLGLSSLPLARAFHRVLHLHTGMIWHLLDSNPRAASRAALQPLPLSTSSHSRGIDRHVHRPRSSATLSPSCSHASSGLMPCSPQAACPASNSACRRTRLLWHSPRRRRRRCPAPCQRRVALPQRPAPLRQHVPMGRGRSPLPSAVSATRRDFFPEMCALYR